MYHPCACGATQKKCLPGYYLASSSIIGGRQVNRGPIVDRVRAGKIQEKESYETIRIANMGRVKKGKFEIKRYS